MEHHFRAPVKEIGQIIYTHLRESIYDDALLWQLRAGWFPRLCSILNLLPHAASP